VLLKTCGRSLHLEQPLRTSVETHVSPLVATGNAPLKWEIGMPGTSNNSLLQSQQDQQTKQDACVETACDAYFFSFKKGCLYPLIFWIKFETKLFLRAGNHPFEESSRQKRERYLQARSLKGSLSMI
jgi:hypothetical protein